MRQPEPPPAAPQARARRRSPGSTSRTHEIKAGDSFAALAEHYYGNQRFARYLADANPAADPYHLIIGSAVDIPPLRTDIQTQRRPAPRAGAGQYRVKAGDSLYGIAESRFGDGTRWKEIYKLNEADIGEDPSRLQVGQVLELPSR